ncbi:unnamed protein product [Camellia sinensis]
MNHNNINVLFFSWRAFYLSHHHRRPPPTSRHAVLAFLAPVLLDFIELKFQGKNVSSFETHQKAIWVAIASLILYCFAYEAKLRLPAYSRIIRRGMTCVLSVVCSVFGKRVGSDSPPVPDGVELGLSENHRLSSARMAAANGPCREQERPASTACVRNESYGGLRVVCVVCESIDGIEECRKLCGGHDYLCTSGLPELFAVYVPACTYEEYNIVLFLWVARFLMKTASQLGSGKKPAGTTSYMGQIEHLMQCRSNVQRVFCDLAEDWLKPSAILEAFESRAARMSVACAQNLTKFSNPEEGFIEKLLQDIPGKGVREQLEALCNIYALFLLNKHQGDFLSTGCITAKQASLANDQLRSLYSQLRPNAIALVDAFNYTDHFFGSILGCYDGNVYPKLYEAAWKDPLNDSVVPEGYHEYIRPLLKQNLCTARL